MNCANALLGVMSQPLNTVPSAAIVVNKTEAGAARPTHTTNTRRPGSAGVTR